MEYQQFKDRIKTYYGLYENGLKKQANKYIEDFVKEIQVLSYMEKETVLYCFAHDLCDEKEYEYLKNRGNGSIPFALNQCLREWLYKKCLENKMPELRWFYELYYQDKIGYKFAFQFLQNAYKSKECDSKTVNLLFAANIDTLGWGAHHFPEGCIITVATRNMAFSKCKEISSERTVDSMLLAQLKYYEVLYSCYDKYVDDGKVKDFSQYCDDANLEFYEAKTYYYDK